MHVANCRLIFQECSSIAVNNSCKQNSKETKEEKVRNTFFCLNPEGANLSAICIPLHIADKLSWLLCFKVITEEVSDERSLIHSDLCLLDGDRWTGREESLLSSWKEH